ncbi:MAG: CoA ester lyase [Ilumatobacteraceae bacterium]|nr:CoA ester lyase [Ilumatobacteraceae bacterium]
MVRPVRSLLFVPGNRTAWMPKAARAGADAVVFDLEGALPPAEKDQGRRAVAEVAESCGIDPSQPAVMVRINDVRSEHWRPDLDRVVVDGLHAVLLPQVAGLDDVVEVDEELTAIESRRGLPPNSIALDPLMETPQAIRQAYEIATCSPRIAYMGAGISKRGDIARTIGYRWSEEGLETLYFRSKVLLDVRAAGVVNPISGMWGGIEDLDGLRRFAEHTAGLGYEGLMVIHPSHVSVVNEVFSPPDSEIELWTATLAAMEEAHESGNGAIRFRGEVVDEAHVLTARQGLERARRLGVVQ